MILVWKCLLCGWTNIGHWVGCTGCRITRQRDYADDLKLFMISAVAFAALFLGAILARADTYVPPADDALFWMGIENTILAEAASEGEIGMTWVACTMRNRGWRLDGYTGSRRKRLEDFVRRQPAHTRLAAHTARVAAQGGFDCGGATHFENVEAFGEPHWAKRMKVVAKVGNHMFYAKR